MKTINSTIANNGSGAQVINTYNPIHHIQERKATMTFVEPIEKTMAISTSRAAKQSPLWSIHAKLSHSVVGLVRLFDRTAPEPEAATDGHVGGPHCRVAETSFATQDSGPPNVIRSIAESPSLRDTIEEIDAKAYPPFMRHTDLQAVWPLVFEFFPEYQLVLLDARSGEHNAHGNVVPFVWDGPSQGLPRTAVEMVQLAIEQKRRGMRPNALGALQAVVNPARQGSGLSACMLQAMAMLAATRGCLDLFAPIRPNQKERYPSVPLDRYVKWTRPDGLPFDAWQRTHVRLGAMPAGVADSWLTVTGTVRDWESWTGLGFPESGEFVVPGALVPVEIDVNRDTGRYSEPHLWMHYRITPPDAESTDHASD